MEGQMQEKIVKWWGIKWKDRFCTLREGRLTIGDRSVNLRQRHNINYAFEKISFKQAEKGMASESELRLWKKKIYRGPVVRCEVTICTQSQKVILRVTHEEECHKWCQGFTKLSEKSNTKSPGISPNKSESRKLSEHKIAAEILKDEEEKIDLMKQAMELNRLATFLTTCKSKKKPSLKKVMGSKSELVSPLTSQQCVTTESKTVTTVTPKTASTVTQNVTASQPCVTTESKTVTTVTPKTASTVTQNVTASQPCVTTESKTVTTVTPKTASTVTQNVTASQSCVTTESKTVTTVTPKTASTVTQNAISTVPQNAMSTETSHLMTQHSSHPTSKSQSLKRQAPFVPQLQIVSEMPVERVKRRGTVKAVKEQSLEGTQSLSHDPLLKTCVSRHAPFQSVSHSSWSSVASPTARHQPINLSKPPKLSPKAPVAKYVKTKATPGARIYDLPERNLLPNVSSKPQRSLTYSPANHESKYSPVDRESKVRVCTQMRPKVPPKPKYLHNSGNTFGPAAGSKLRRKPLPIFDPLNVKIKPSAKSVKRDVRKSLDEDFPSVHCVWCR